MPKKIDKSKAKKPKRTGKFKLATDRRIKKSEISKPRK